MATWSIKYPLNISPLGTNRQQGFEKHALEFAEIYNYLNLVRKAQAGTTAPVSPEINELWLNTSETTPILNYWNGTTWQIIFPPSSPNRNTVLQGHVSSSGEPELFTGSTGALTVQLNATDTPAIFSFMNGNSASTGAVDIIDSVAADDALFWNSLPQNSTVYLYVNHSAGTLTGGFTTEAPVYQNYAPAHANGRHWINFNTGLVQSSDGSTWTARNRVFVGAATTDTTKVTAVVCYKYNYTTVDMLPVETDTTLSSNSNRLIPTQAAVKTYIDSKSQPEGTIIWTGRGTAPTGYLKANGAAISRTTYSTLFDVIGTTFGVGDGSTTFNIPDLRGEFIRGWDDGLGVDPDRVRGSKQTDLFKAHVHTYLAFNAGGAINSGGAYSVSSGESGTTGGAETRPRNIALLACIKY